MLLYHVVNKYQGGMASKAGQANECAGKISPPIPQKTTEAALEETAMSEPMIKKAMTAVKIFSANCNLQTT